MAEAAEGFDALLVRARANDAEALALLVAQYEPKLRIVARVLLGPALRPYLDSLDLVQSVHKSLMVGLRDDRFALSDPNQLLQLALTIVRRKAARHWRRLRRQRRLDDRASGGENLPDLLASLSSPRSDPAEAAAFNDQVRQLWASLEPPERRLLELRLDGHSNDEMARQLGLSPVALRVRLTRLRQRLRAAGVVDDWL